MATLASSSSNVTSSPRPTSFRGKMDASEFKEYIFSMLFLKGRPDVFEARFGDLVAKGRSDAEARKRASAKSYDSDTFCPRAGPLVAST